MAYLKLALIVFLAIGATQCQGASVAEPEPRDLDIFLAAQQAIKIVQNVIAAVEKGIEDSKPSIDILLGQLTPELGKAVKKVLDEALALVKKERERIEFVIKEVQDILDAIKKIKSCTDPEKKNIEKALAKLENGLLEAIRSVIKSNQEDLQDLKDGFKLLLNEARKILDGEIKNFIGCIKPGHSDAKKCIENEVEKTKKAVIALVGKVVMFVEEISDTMMVVIEELAGKAMPLIEAFKKDADPIMKNVSGCIAKLK